MVDLTLVTYMVDLTPVTYMIMVDLTPVTYMIKNSSLLKNSYTDFTFCSCQSAGESVSSSISRVQRGL